MKNRQSIFTGVLLIVAIVVVVNVISYSYFFRLDFTKDKRYTLSKPTVEILKDLKQPVTVTAYFSENLPPQISQVRTDFKDLLIEYAMRSGNKVVYNFINPNKSDSLEKDAVKQGIEPTTVNIREKDEMKKQRAYLGATVKYGDKVDVISFVQNNGTVLPAGGPMENALSTSIKKLSNTKKPFIGLLQGNGEPTKADVQQIDESLRAMYDFEEVRLTDTSAIPEGCKTLLLMDPKDTFSTGQLKRLDDFLAKGGHMFIAYSGLNYNLQTLTGNVSNIGLTPWLAGKGMMLEPKFVIDAPPHCGSVNIPEQMGGMQLYRQVLFPYSPTITNLAEHPITQGLSVVLMPFTSSIRFTGDTNKTPYKVIATTSEHAGLLSTPLTFDLNHNWQESDFPLSNLTVAASLSGINGNKDSRIVLISCATFAINGNDKHPKEPDDIGIVVNSVDWLSDDSGLIELRSKVVKPEFIKDLSDSARLAVKWLNFLLPILLVIIYGLIRSQMKKRIRIKRMEEVYDKEA